VVKINRFTLLSSIFSFSQLKKKSTPHPFAEKLVTPPPTLCHPVSTYASNPRGSEIKGSFVATREICVCWRVGKKEALPDGLEQQVGSMFG
jgi:hypothetical protein